MLCTRCKKRQAMIFMTKFENGKPVNEGLCLQCAMELNIPEVQNMLKSNGITPEDVEEMNQMMDGLMDPDSMDDDLMGGTEQALPGFITKMFQNMERNTQNGGELVQGNGEGTRSSSDKNSKNQKDKDKKRKFLTNYCTNLTQKARDGQLDRIIGRDKEIYRVTQILSRRTKNNPCLIGEPGVGKTAIAEGIAQKIVNRDVPFKLLNKEIYLLDLTALVAGTQFRGQFESRMKSLIEEVKNDGNIILFIDEVHTLVGTGDSEGSMNASNIMKPALSRGEIQVIGATTFAEYRKNIEKDAALERRFQPVTVEEPTLEQTVEILKGIKTYYEKYHKVFVTDDILELAAKWSERYITDRYLPDKAIDLLDEACACASIKNTVLVKYEQLNDKMKELTDEISELEQNTENVDYEKLAMKQSELMQVKEQIKEIEKDLSDCYVTQADLAKVVELYTGIPSAKVEQSELKKIAELDKAIKSKVIGQDEAVDAVVAAIKRARLNLSKRKRPASFIFVGPTGVGKTELVKVLSTTLFDSVDPLIRLDMSEYMEKHSVARLIGSPPGYVGYDDAGQLTEKVRRKPYSVILFDEIEKAHPDVMNILLQILDEGKISDAHGRTVNFDNTVIVMTSNAGSSQKNGLMGFNKTENEFAKEKAMKALSEFLRPEFLGRVDEVVVFNLLDNQSIKKIAALLLDELKEPLAEKNIKFSYDDKALEKIAELSGGGQFNARDIRKTIRKEVEDRIANCLIDNSDRTVSAMSLTVKETDGKTQLDLQAI